MDIIKPELVWIKDRCYRKLPIRACFRNPEDEDVYTENLNEVTESESCYDDIDIKCENSSFWTSIYVSSELIKHIVGKESSMRKRIEDQTKAKINIPNRQQKNGEITISGNSKNSVGEAYRRIENLADNARWRVSFTHFISFPMNHENIQQSFLHFKEEILSRFKMVRGMHRSIFQNPNKLHITVSTLVLLDSKERENASTILEKCKNDILDVIHDKPLTVRVQGVEYMNDDPAEVDVLYAKVSPLDQEEDSLQVISDKLAGVFVNAKLSKRQHDHVKLHITLMNSRFREVDASERLSAVDRDTFDARPILEHFQEYEFGTVDIAEIHISVRNEHRKDGYYFPTSILKISS